MRHNGVLGVAVLVLAFLTAGCADAASTAGASTSSAAPIPTSAAPATVTADTGGIEGVVVDQEEVPVGGVRVVIVENSDETVSAADGAFTFSGLAPGLYKVATDHPGFEQALKAATVVAGEVATVRFVLEAKLVSEPRSAHFVGRGFIEFALAVPGTFTKPNATGADMFDFYYEVAPDAVSAVNAMAWVAGAPATLKLMYLSLWVTKGQCVDVCDLINGTFGPSPLMVRSDELADFIGGKGYEVNSYMLPASCHRVITSTDTTMCQSHPDALVGAAFQQVFTVYTSVFFVEPAPPGYSPLPP